MVTRLIKAVGYGLTNMAIDPDDNMRTNDSRINFESPAFTFDLQPENTDASYLQRLAKKTENWAEPDFYTSPEMSLVFSLRILETQMDKEEAKESHSLLEENIIYDGEYGDPGTLLIIPPGLNKSWYRYGDAIDSIEFSLQENPSESPTVKVLPFSPYPFGNMMDKRTGLQVSEDLAGSLRSMETLKSALVRKSLNEEARDSLIKGLELLQNHAVKKTGLTDFEEFTETIVPLVPVEVQDFVEWAGIFTDKDAWKDLRPMVYTYWS